jgi:hypothetical protein
VRTAGPLPEEERARALAEFEGTGDSERGRQESSAQPEKSSTVAAILLGPDSFGASFEAFRAGRYVRASWYLTWGVFQILLGFAVVLFGIGFIGALASWLWSSMSAYFKR